MDLWREAVKAVKPQSWSDILLRPSHSDEGLGPAIHPEQYGATDDLRLAAAYGDDLEEYTHTNRQDALRQEANDLVEALGIQDPFNIQQRRPDRDSSTIPEGQSLSSPASPTGATTPIETASKPVSGAGLLSSLLRLQAIQQGLVNKEYKDLGKERRMKWYEQGDGITTPNSRLSSIVNAAQPRRFLQQKPKEEAKLTVHVAAIIARQRYIMQLCRAFMAYGAPTHRLEQNMLMTAQVLDVNAQFLYMPGCMIMSFDDTATHTAQVKLVRSTQGIDLGRLTEVHDIYKSVVHDIISAEEASEELDKIMKRKPRYNKPFLILLYGLASAAVGPWAFDARPIDLPIIFFLGSLVGFMQLVVAPYSVLFSNVFEVSMAILISFLARAFGSIPATGPFRQPGRKYTFCFSAIAQSSICLILPGFTVLCSSLELQSHQIIAGSVRMVYTIIYSLFLGYGITIGTTIYGLMDGNATTESTCPGAEAIYGKNEYVQHFPFVIAFCFLSGLVYQAKLRQTPAMMIFGLAGYVTNYFCAKRLVVSTGLANTAGAFALGTCGNLYSRIWRGHAAPAIMPGIFTIVSSGLAATGAIISGLSYSEAIKNRNVHLLSSGDSMGNTNASLTGLGLGMIEVAIAISVGLFISALLVYPYGKQRSGLFNF